MDMKPKDLVYNGNEDFIKIRVKYQRDSQVEELPIPNSEY